MPAHRALLSDCVFHFEVALLALPLQPPRRLLFDPEQRAALLCAEQGAEIGAAAKANDPPASLGFFDSQI
jgi:hypothetical protein